MQNSSRIRSPSGHPVTVSRHSHVNRGAKEPRSLGNWGKEHWQRHKIKAKPKRSVTYRHRHRPSDKRDKVMFPRNRLSALQATTLLLTGRGGEGAGTGGGTEHRRARRKPQAPSRKSQPKTKTKPRPNQDQDQDPALTHACSPATPHRIPATVEPA
ncbi:GD21331 [Drosophila simulans]|uniref:GD21331 n=1 Tax=Drosophila simulans TaxID=7240 RepID=B4QXF5_DROSI|nr:GD21331 [Drosophila simulans]